MPCCILCHGYFDTCITPYPAPGGSIYIPTVQSQVYNMRFFISSMVSCRSPLLAISVMMSHPPSNSPLTYSCGNVGQSNIFFNPCRTSSSDRMSKVLKGSWVALRAATTRWLKPHLGSSGVPAQHTSFQTKCCFPNTVSFAKAAAETHLARLQSLLSSRPEGQRQFHAATVPLVVRRVAMMWLVLSHKASGLQRDVRGQDSMQNTLLGRTLLMPCRVQTYLS